MTFHNYHLFSWPGSSVPTLGSYRQSLPDPDYPDHSNHPKQPWPPWSSDHFDCPDNPDHHHDHPDPDQKCVQNCDVRAVSHSCNVLRWALSLQRREGMQEGGRSCACRKQNRCHICHFHFHETPSMLRSWRGQKIPTFPSFPCSPNSINRIPNQSIIIVKKNRNKKADNHHKLL